MHLYWDKKNKNFVKAPFTAGGSKGNQSDSNSEDTNPKGVEKIAEVLGKVNEKFDKFIKQFKELSDSFNLETITDEIKEKADVTKIKTDLQTHIDDTIQSFMNSMLEPIHTLIKGEIGTFKKETKSDIFQNAISKINEISMKIHILPKKEDIVKFVVQINDMQEKLKKTLAEAETAIKSIKILDKALEPLKKADNFKDLEEKLKSNIESTNTILEKLGIHNENIDALTEFNKKIIDEYNGLKKYEKLIENKDFIELYKDKEERDEFMNYCIKYREGKNQLHDYDKRVESDTQKLNRLQEDLLGLLKDIKDLGKNLKLKGIDYFNIILDNEKFKQVPEKIDKINSYDEYLNNFEREYFPWFNLYYIFFVYYDDVTPVKVFLLDMQESIEHYRTRFFSFCTKSGIMLNCDRIKLFYSKYNSDNFIKNEKQSYLMHYFNNENTKVELHVMNLENLIIYDVKELRYLISRQIKHEIKDEIKDEIKGNNIVQYRT
jgi:hypothetical protein